MNMLNHHNDERPPPEGGASPAGHFLEPFQMTKNGHTYHWKQ